MDSRASRSFTADWVFYDGAVHTVDRARPWAQAVAVCGTRIAYVGSTAGAQAFTGPNTRSVDLDGAMVLPGFVESHVHFVHGAMSDNPDLPLSAVNTQQELGRLLEQYAREHPDADPVLGRGWKHFLFPQPPTRAMLDRIFPDRAVQLTSVDGHSSWVNGVSLERAGIDGSFPDPEPGFSYFVRDEQGEPTGFLIEGASDIVSEALIRIDSGYIREAVQRFGPRFSAQGLTTVYDAGVIRTNEHDAFQALQDLDRDGELGLRVVGSHVVDSDGDASEALARLAQMRDRYRSDHLRVSVLKIFLDGVPETHTALLLEPYADQPDFVGMPNLDPNVFRALVAEADGSGIDVHVHAIGEGATRMVLDAVEAAQAANGRQGSRHTSCHVYYVDRADLRRFRQLGVIAQTSGEWILWDESHDLLTGLLGCQRTQQLYPLHSLVSDGAVVTLGSDWPASTNIVSYSPLMQIEMAHTRRPPGDPDAEALPPQSEGLSLPDAIAALTINGAYQLRMEDEVGSLEAGKRADLIVLENNLFDIPPHEIHDTGVLLTLMDGRVVHQSPAWQV